MPETVLIFDLDDCLFETTYYLNTYGDSFYDCITFNPTLYNILSSISQKKFIFTNANLSHAKKILQKLKIIQFFEMIFSRDNLNCMKPSDTAFLKVNGGISNHLKMNKYHVIFFEDNYNNLIQSTKYNWYTVWINKERATSKNKQIDFTFYSIIDALSFLNSNILN